MLTCWNDIIGYHNFVGVSVQHSHKKICRIEVRERKFLALPIRR